MICVIKEGHKSKDHTVVMPSPLLFLHSVVEDRISLSPGCLAFSEKNHVAKTFVLASFHSLSHCSSIQKQESFEH